MDKLDKKIEILITQNAKLQVVDLILERSSSKEEVYQRLLDLSRYSHIDYYQKYPELRGFCINNRPHTKEL